MRRVEGALAQVSISPWSTGQFLPADLPGGLVEPGAHSFLPVLVEVRVQNHSIPAGGHGCLLPCNTAERHEQAVMPAHTALGQRC